MKRLLRSRLLFAGMVACLLILVLLGRLPTDADWAVTLTNSAHGPVFGAVTLALLARRREHIRDQRSLWGNVAFAVLLAIVLGAVVEVLQHFLGRDAELRDLGYDALGAFAAAGFFINQKMRALGHGTTARPVAAVVCASLASGFLLLPGATSALAYVMQANRFPVLLDGEGFLGGYFLRTYDCVAVKSALPGSLDLDNPGTTGLHVTGTEAGWALGFWETTKDWRGRKFYAIRIANPNAQELVLRLRFFDRRRKRSRGYSYYRTVRFEPHAVSTARVSLDEMAAAIGPQQMDLSRMAGVIAYGSSVPDARGFYLIRMWLE